MVLCPGVSGLDIAARAGDEGQMVKLPPLGLRRTGRDGGRGRRIQSFSEDAHAELTGALGVGDARRNMTESATCNQNLSSMMIDLVSEF